MTSAGGFLVETVEIVEPNVLSVCVCMRVSSNTEMVKLMLQAGTSCSILFALLRGSLLLEDMKPNTNFDVSCVGAR
jgi:hypothetical protein